jgi:hypothetical protein
MGGRGRSTGGDDMILSRYVLSTTYRLRFADGSIQIFLVDCQTMNQAGLSQRRRIESTQGQVHPGFLRIGASSRRRFVYL